ncbi:MAG TPA: hypothetical protein VKT52_06325, partial [Ktedonobacterales bacterium]|nr:hypothetical protein [Ktedonobacterales bacterium]
WHPTRKPSAPARMSKAEALALTHRLKRGAVWAALGVFAVLAGLVGAHVVGSASASAASPSTESSGSTDDKQPSIQQNNPFFGSQSGGGSFGSNGGNSQSPVTGSGVS